MSSPTQERETALRLLAGFLPTIVWVTDADLRVTAAFGEGISGLDVRRGELIGLTIREIFRGDPSEPAVAAHERAVRGEPATYVQRFRARTFRCRVEPLYDHGELAGVMGVALDVTEHTEDKRRGLEAELRYRSLVEQVPAVVYSSPARGRDGIEFVSPQIEQLLGRTAEEWAGDPELWKASIHPEDRDRVLAEWERAVQGETTFESEYRMIRADGRVVWVRDQSRRVLDTDGRPLCWQGVYTDVTERRRREEDLRRTNQALRALIEASPLAIAAVDLRGNVTLWNPAAERMFGWSEREVLGKPIPTIPPTAREEWTAVLTSGSGGAVISAGETRRLRKDGTEIELEISRAPIRNASGDIVGILGIFTDIAERKRAQAALRASEERYRELFENALDAIYTHDLDGRITSVNKAAERMIGLPRERLVGLPMWKLIAPEHVDTARGMLERKLAGGGPTRYEIEVSDRRGKRIPVEVTTRLIYEDGRPIGVQGIARDISERVRTQESLQRSERQFRSLIENALDMIAVLDEDLTVRYASPSIKRVLGYEPAELIGRSVADLLHPEDVPLVHQGLERGRRGGGEVVGLEVRAHHRDGTWRVIEGIGVNLVEDDDIRGIVVNARDITERKLSEERLQILSRVSEALSSSLGLEQTLTDLGRIIVRRLADWCVITIRGEGDAARRLVAHRDPEKAATARSLIERHPPDLDERSPLRDLLASERPRLFRVVPPEVIDGMEEDERRHLVAELGMRSAMAVPLAGRAGVVGTLTTISSSAERLYDEHDLVLVGEIGRRAAVSVENARLFEAARESEARFRQLVEGIQDYAILMLDPEGNVASWHPTAERTFGYKAEEILGRPVALLYRSADADAGVPRRMLDEAATSGTVEEEGWRVRKDGSHLWAVASTTALRDSEGRLTGFSRVTRDISERKLAQQRLEQSLQALQRTDEERRRVLARLVEAQEDERERIAADIHDDSLQVMVAVGMRLEMLERRVHDAEAREDLEQLREVVAESVRRLRTLLFDVRPQALDTEGLAAALRLYVSQMQNETGIETEVSSHLEEEPPTEIATIAYRIAAEALQNVKKHARASRIVVSLEERDDGLLVRVSDDGVGFARSDIDARLPGHLGLVTMRERAEIAGGWFRIQTNRGEGTTVEFWLPVPGSGISRAS